MRGRLVVGLLGFVLGGCTAHTTPNHVMVADAGISLALYADGQKSYAVVDDRRWLDISGSKVLLGNIDPGAALASLVIETADPAVRIGPCSRERMPEVFRDPLEDYGLEQERLAAERMRARMRRPLPNVPPPEPAVPRSDGTFAPIVTCSVAGPPGRQLVRIVYVSSTLTCRAQHDIEVRDDATATLDSRYAIATPPWRAMADVVVFDGVPGGDHVPRELVRGRITLDGGTSVLVIPTRTVATQLRRVYTGQLVGEVDPEIDELSPNWPGEAVNAVWATLELPGTTLSPGRARVHVERAGEQQRWIDVAPALLARRDDAEKQPLRLPLWIDDTIRVALSRSVVENDGQRMVEVFAASITNIGDVPREVWVEAHARRAKRRRVERPWPKKPTASGDIVRSIIEAKPGKLERVGYLVVYEL
jgi:hypothetical protein